MKYLLASLTLTALIVSCANAPQADKVTLRNEQTASTITGNVYSLDTTSSRVTWTGTKPTGQHLGTFKLDSGVISLEKNQLKGGSFIININSLTNLDLQGEDKTKLEGHLKSADFFDSNKYPLAKFEITSVTPFDSSQVKSVLPNSNVLISGNLTLKNTTKNVTFPAVVTISNAFVAAKANFNIDRTQWGLSYGNDQSLRDNFIRPEVNIQLELKAKK